jgi:hypothetical protein
VALLDSARDAFSDRDAPLHLLLGLISFARRLDGLAAPEARQPRQEGHEGDGPPTDASIHLVLGLLSFRKTLLASLGPIRAAHLRRAQAGAESAEPPTALPDLLR